MHVLAPKHLEPSHYACVAIVCSDSLRLERDQIQMANYAAPIAEAQRRVARLLHPFVDWFIDASACCSR